jgi:putative transcriptional regulator
MASPLRHIFSLAVVFLMGVCRLPAQPRKTEDLALGKILVTPRQSPDPPFAESVILIVRYGSQGALGLMVNRRTTVPISRALQELPAAAGHSDPVFVGGPVELDTVFALARAPRNTEGSTKVFGGISFISAMTPLQKAISGDTSPKALRIFLGYCGWGASQLESEVRRGGWFIVDPQEDVVFTPEPAKLWDKLIAGTEGVNVRLRLPALLYER